MASYWEKSAALMSRKTTHRSKPEDSRYNPLLRAACLPIEVVQEWRDGKPSESILPLKDISSFAYATSAVGDLGLGIISKLLGNHYVGLS